MVSFLLNDEPCYIEEPSADETVLQLLRERMGLTGTKEGCASGDCGACTVVLATPADDQQAAPLTYKTVNSCITPLSQLHGKQLLTVEHLADGEDLHPVQQALVDCHGSQCGFCTPGFVMSLFALYHCDARVDREHVIDALGGNLCRCTGYRPITDAALTACQSRQPDKFDDQADKVVAFLQGIEHEQSANKLFIPKTSAELADLLARYPGAQIIAGGSDLMLEVTQRAHHFSHLISIHKVAQCQGIRSSSAGLSVGAAVTLSECETHFQNSHPQLAKLLSRFASRQIRNTATIGGNIANASPIGDLAPALLALNSFLEIGRGEALRKVPLSAFFTGYRKTLLAPDEWIERLVVPTLCTNQIFKVYKVSKRFDDDISAVCAAFLLTVENDRIEALSTGFGGVAATPAQASALDAALVGLPWSSEATMERGRDVLSAAFQPIDDVRASAHYRSQMLRALWHRFWLETNNSDMAIQVEAHA